MELRYITGMAVCNYQYEDIYIPEKHGDSKTCIQNGYLLRTIVVYIDHPW